MLTTAAAYRALVTAITCSVSICRMPYSLILRYTTSQHGLEQFFLLLRLIASSKYFGMELVHS
jgi:hypothetical protein